MQAVPYPKAHVLGYEERFVGNSLVVDVVGYIDEAGQLLVHTVVRRPYPLFVVVCTVHLNKHAMLGGYGVEIAVAVVSIVLFVVVEVGPCAFQFAQFGLRSQIAGFTITAEGFVEYEGAFLAGAQLVDHRADILFQTLALVGIGA